MRWVIMMPVPILRMGKQVVMMIERDKRTVLESWVAENLPVIY